MSLKLPPPSPLGINASGKGDQTPNYDDLSMFSGRKITPNLQGNALTASEKIAIFYQSYFSDKPPVIETNKDKEILSQKLMESLPQKLLESFAALKPQIEEQDSLKISAFVEIKSKLKRLKSDCQRILKEEAFATPKKGFFRTENLVRISLTNLLKDLIQAEERVTAKISEAAEIAEANAFIGKDVIAIQNEVQKKVKLDYVEFIDSEEAETTLQDLERRVAIAQSSTQGDSKTEVGLIRLLIQWTHFQAELSHIKANGGRLLRCNTLQTSVDTKILEIKNALKKLRMPPPPLMPSPKARYDKAFEEADAGVETTILKFTNLASANKKKLEALTQEVEKPHSFDDLTTLGTHVEELKKSLEKSLKENTKQTDFCVETKVTLQGTQALEMRILEKELGLNLTKEQLGKIKERLADLVPNDSKSSDVNFQRISRKIFIVKKAIHATERYINLFGEKALMYLKEKGNKTIKDSFNPKELSDFEALIKLKTPKKTHARDAIKLLREGLTRKDWWFGSVQKITPAMLVDIEALERVIDDLPE